MENTNIFQENVEANGIETTFKKPKIQKPKQSGAIHYFISFNFIM